MEPLIDILQSIYPVSEAFLLELKRFLRREEVGRKQWLLRPGEISSKIYFIEKGLVRGFYIHNDKEVTVWFMKENDLIISIISFYTRQPSEEYIELLEDGVVWSITYEQLQLLFHNFIEFNFASRVLTERYYALSELRAQKLRLPSAQDRYLQLLEEIPDIFTRAPLKYIASSLGLTPETVSRIRAKKL
ncbi:Crp/Fnr family transcriptional regulator [Spirosoma agri]|uniref:Crp/Fnr family transcriptional regulator n=1 Tax=Spirosoma agri TaxID=1987381 RepID=A0A6M0INF4_9BACT|nr:Crp/Fnr family transcriptional regulator [Spirosoma agri]NEU69472.1 Crp/Fnr family transcriptional regulator [Spirosoma agri]